MTPKTKKILITTGLLIAAIAAFGYKKVTELQTTFGYMTISPLWVKNVRAGINMVKFDLDVILKNPTADDFNVAGIGVLSLNRLAIIYQGDIIGTAVVNISDISVAAHGTTTIHAIPVEIPTITLLSNLSNIISNTSQFTAQLSFIGYMTLLGSEYQIGE